MLYLYFHHRYIFNITSWSLNAHLRSVFSTRSYSHIVLQVGILLPSHPYSCIPLIMIKLWLTLRLFKFVAVTYQPSLTSNIHCYSSEDLIRSIAANAQGHIANARQLPFHSFRKITCPNTSAQNWSTFRFPQTPEECEFSMIESHISESTPHPFIYFHLDYYLKGSPSVQSILSVVLFSHL